MTSRKKWPFVITLFLILGLVLVACERPLPGDGSEDAPGPEVPATMDPGLYPGPDSGEPAEPPPDAESGSGYPAPDTEQVEPAQEGEAAAEPYPAAEGDVPEGETTAETPAGDGAEGETAEGETAEGETATGNVAEGEAAEGETAEGETTAGETAAGDAAEEPTGERTHTVAAGDNLFQIGLLYGISWVEIAQANGIVNPDSLTVGQVLIIPAASETAVAEEGDSGEAAETAETEDSESAVAEETTPAEGEAAETIYVVQSGDNLYRISLKFGVNMMDVARANDLASFDDLAVGQELVIPGVAAAETETAPEASTGEEITHAVKEGETVFGIAFKYGIPWTELVELNNLSSPYTLEGGQILLIPTGE